MLVDAKAPAGAGPASPGRGGGGGGAQAGANGVASPGGAETSAEALWARYASRLTGIIVRHLRADYWHMPQARAHLPRVSGLLCRRVTPDGAALVRHLRANCRHMPQARAQCA